MSDIVFLYFCNVFKISEFLFPSTQGFLFHFIFIWTLQSKCNSIRELKSSRQASLFLHVLAVLILSTRVQQGALWTRPPALPVVSTNKRSWFKRDPETARCEVRICVHICLYGYDEKYLAFVEKQRPKAGRGEGKRDLLQHYNNKYPSSCFPVLILILNYKKKVPHSVSGTCNSGFNFFKLPQNVFLPILHCKKLNICFSCQNSCFF